jgi:predicted nucleic acid-binding Zn ribbon protein
MVQRTCRVCYQPFPGRRDARTCSPRCRKRLSRTRRELVETTLLLSEEVHFEPDETGKTGGILSRLTTVKHMRQLLMIFAGSVFIAAGGLGSPPTSAEISQGYMTQDQALSQHMAVMLTGETANGYPLVQATDAEKEPKNALGVAVSLDESLLAVSPVSTGVYVVDRGPVQVYVSDLNGAPKVGDLLAISPLKGVLMKSTDETVASFGVAMEDFDSDNAQEVEVEDHSGDTLTTKVAVMDINVDVSPPLKSASETSDNWLQATAYNLTGRQLSTVRIVAILMIFFVMMVIVSEIVYGVISGSINALGRNPLARDAITRQSLRSLLVAGAVMAFGTIILLALLWF